MKVNVKVEKEYTVDVNPLEILNNYFKENPYLFNVDTNLIKGKSKSAKLIMTKDGVKVLNTLSYGYFGGHYDEDPVTEIIPVPEEYLQEKIKLFEAYHTLKAYMEGNDL